MFCLHFFFVCFFFLFFFCLFFVLSRCARPQHHANANSTGDIHFHKEIRSSVTPRKFRQEDASAGCQSIFLYWAFCQVIVKQVVCQCMLFMIAENTCAHLGLKFVKLEKCQWDQLIEKVICNTSTSFWIHHTHFARLFPHNFYLAVDPALRKMCKKCHSQPTAKNQKLNVSSLSFLHGTGQWSCHGPQPAGRRRCCSQQVLDLYMFFLPLLIFFEEFFLFSSEKNKKTQKGFLDQCALHGRIELCCSHDSNFRVQRKAQIIETLFAFEKKPFSMSSMYPQR